MVNVGAIPEGAYAVGVSGGADSVALLFLLREMRGVEVHVVHLNHQTRGEGSEGDARFVRELARRVGARCTVGIREEVERGVTPLPANASARYRAARFALFGRVCRENALRGVVLAHHADDQAETVMQRVLRGSTAFGALAGMEGRGRVAGVEVYRPLLAVRRAELRDFLTRRGEPWREDPSNESGAYLRNRLRRVLGAREELARRVVEFGGACRTVRDWVGGAAPALAEAFRLEEVNALPEVLAREAVRRWMIGRGVPAGEIDGVVIGRLLRMAGDAGVPGSVNLPGGVIARRRGGRISRG